MIPAVTLHDIPMHRPRYQLSHCMISRCTGMDDTSRHAAQYPDAQAWMIPAVTLHNIPRHKHGYQLSCCVTSRCKDWVPAITVLLAVTVHRNKQSHCSPDCCPLLVLPRPRPQACARLSLMQTYMLHWNRGLRGQGGAYASCTCARLQTSEEEDEEEEDEPSDVIDSNDEEEEGSGRGKHGAGGRGGAGKGRWVFQIFFLSCACVGLTVRLWTFHQ